MGFDVFEQLHQAIILKTVVEQIPANKNQH
jgi:hypothetical protein